MRDEERENITKPSIYDTPRWGKTQGKKGAIGLHHPPKDRGRENQELNRHESPNGRFDRTIVPIDKLFHPVVPPKTTQVFSVSFINKEEREHVRCCRRN